MWQRVRQLTADGHRLILFSNINAIHAPWIYDEFPEFPLFDGAVFSFETGFVKPQPEIYQYAIDDHGLVPAETLYIDDLPAERRRRPRSRVSTPGNTTSTITPPSRTGSPPIPI